MAKKEKRVKADGVKKPFYKKPWFIALVVVVILGALFGGGSKGDEKDTPETKPEEAETQTESLSFEIVAGQANEYSKEVVMSEGTDLEEKLIVYYVPAGDYSVENLGDYATQVTVYEGFALNKDTGYDEYTNTGDVVLINKGESKDINVPDGWYIEVAEPTHIKLTQK